MLRCAVLSSEDSSWPQCVDELDDTSSFEWRRDCILEFVGHQLIINYGRGKLRQKWMLELHVAEVCMVPDGGNPLWSTIAEGDACRACVLRQNSRQLHVLRFFDAERMETFTKVLRYAQERESELARARANLAAMEKRLQTAEVVAEAESETRRAEPAKTPQACHVAASQQDDLIRKPQMVSMMSPLSCTAADSSDWPSPEFGG